MLHALAGGNRLTMTECKRSDNVLFSWYASLALGGSRHKRPLQDNLAEARATFSEERAAGFMPGTRLAPVNFVISHRLRVALNAQCNAAEAEGGRRPGAERFTLKEFGISSLDPHRSNPQDAYFWPGQRVIACCSGRRLRNGLVYEIESLDERTVTLRRPDPSALLQGPAQTEGATTAADESASDSEPSPSNAAATIELPRAVFFRSVRLTHAVTYASLQGLTIEGLIALHDTTHLHFRPKHLFVALSRARGANNVIVH